MNQVCLQSSFYTVPYAVAGAGKNFCSSSPSSVVLVTKMFRAGLMKHEDDCGRPAEQVDRLIKSFPKQFALNRASFSSNLLTKGQKNRAHASQMLHLFFCVPRNSAVIPPGEREQVDAIHAMLRLDPHQTLLDVSHPLSREHGAAAETLRFFSAAGKAAEQIFRCTGKETVAGQFLQALGAINAVCSSILL